MRRRTPSVGSSSAFSIFVEGPIELRGRGQLGLEIADVRGEVRDLGFQGKLCIHPDQISTANTAFTPTEEQLAFAKKVIDAFVEAEAAGSASIQIDGYFVDYPIVDKAQRIVDIAEAIARAEAA